MKFEIIDMPELQCKIHASGYLHLKQLLDLEIARVTRTKSGIEFNFSKYGEELTIKPSTFLDHVTYRPMARTLAVPKTIFDLIEEQVISRSEVIRIPKFTDIAVNNDN